MIKLWNISTKSCLQSIDNGSAVNSMTTLVDDIVLTGGISNTIKLWDANELLCLGELKGHGCTVWCLAPFEDGVQIVSGSSDNSIKIWDLNEFKCTGTLEGHDNSISSLKIMKSKLLLSGSWDFTVKIWNLNTKLCVYTMKGHTGIVFAFSTSLLIQAVTVGFVDKCGGDAAAWRKVAIIYAIIGLVVNTISAFSVKELPEEELNEGEVKNNN